MTSLTFKDLDDDTKNKMKLKYMSYESIAKIAREFNVNRTTLQYQVNTYWMVERDQAKADLYNEFNDTKKLNSTRMQNSAISIMVKALEALDQREFPPTMQEARQAKEIFETVDKITRLDEGAPTEITGEKAVAMKDIQAKLDLDPFKKDEIKEVSFVEVKPKKKTRTKRSKKDEK